MVGRRTGEGRRTKEHRDRHSHSRGTYNKEGTKGKVKGRRKVYKGIWHGAIVYVCVLAQGNPVWGTQCVLEP